MEIIKTIKKLTVIIAIIGLAIATSCVKEGPTGATGNANVYANTYVINAWSVNSNNFYTDIYVSALTSDVQNYGTVQVFFSYNSGNDWNAMPFTYSSNPYYVMTYSTEVHHVFVDWIYSGTGFGTDPNTVYGTSCMFKVVVIPPAAKRPNVNMNNYAEVKAVYGLKD